MNRQHPNIQARLPGQEHLWANVSAKRLLDILIWGTELSFGVDVDCRSISRVLLDNFRITHLIGSVDGPPLNVPAPDKRLCVFR